MEKDRITGIICKGTKIRLNGICFLSYLLFQIPHRSTLQFYLNLSFCQLFISLDIAANVDIILKCHWFWKLKTRAKNCQRDFVFLIIQAENSMSIIDRPFLKRSSNPTFFCNWNSYSFGFCRIHFVSFLDASSHLYERVCPSVGPSVGPYVTHSVTLLWKMPEIENFKYRNDLNSIEWMDNLKTASWHLYKRVCLSVRLSVGPSVRNAFGHAFAKNDPKLRI